jgi:hypothetical protein
MQSGTASRGRTGCSEASNSSPRPRAAARRRAGVGRALGVPPLTSASELKASAKNTALHLAHPGVTINMRLGGFAAMALDPHPR